jgi:apolipoprotein N-acyltransferase
MAPSMMRVQVKLGLTLKPMATFLLSCAVAVLAEKKETPKKMAVNNNLLFICVFIFLYAKKHNFGQLRGISRVNTAFVFPMRVQTTKTIAKQWDETHPLIRRRSGHVRFQDDPVGYFKFFSILKHGIFFLHFSILWLKSTK